jgi:DHA2 family multidrug resistance protein-like MFS transporter
VGAAFVRRQGRLDYPLLELALFRQRRFSAAVAAYGLSCMAMFGVYIFITQYLQLVLGLTPLRSGVVLLPWSLGFVVGSLYTTRLARRFAPVDILVWGMVATAAGFVPLALAASPGVPLLVAATLAMSLGLAPAFTVGNEMIITAAPPQRAGAASAISETSAELSGALGIALLGSLGALLYRHALAGAWPGGLASADAAQALATLGGAVALADGLPAAQGTALLGAAREAFGLALRCIAAVGAVLVLLAGAVAARILRGAR